MLRYLTFPLLTGFFIICFIIKVGHFFSQHVPVFWVAELNAETETPKSETATPPESPKKPTPPEEDSTIKAQENLCSQTQMDLLKNLSKRREDLNQREKDITIKERILEVGQQKVESKINDLKALQKTVEDLLAKYDEKESIKIKSLIKIYENMKPKEAARILEQLETDILLQVIDGMKEAKVATILANMDPAKANYITAEFAKQKKLIPPAE